jgi:ubiquinone/menaquinone biosynthesis C-methylase UbiE
MELLSATAAYRNFLEAQVKLLRLTDGDRVADLGAGTGDFSLSISGRAGPKSMSIVEVDFIQDALRRAVARRARTNASHRPRLMQCMINLDLRRGQVVPLANASFDAVLASLLISYVSAPKRLLREVLRIVKPGGRVVVSSMVKDADVSMLFHDGLVEYATAEARSLLSEAAEGSFERLVRDFLNDGARLFELEERGRFQFWDEADLRYAVASAEVESRQGFGEPAQAVIVSARRP